MTEEKKRLRREFKKIRDSIEKSVRASESERIIKNLIETEEYKSAKTVFAYVSFGSEVETYNLLKRILADGKRLAVPLCDTDSRIMSAICIDDLTQLVCGAYGIPEPPKDGIVLGRMKLIWLLCPLSASTGAVCVSATAADIMISFYTALRGIRQVLLFRSV